MEIVEMYCDLLLARFGLVTQMKELDAGIAEPVSSLIWVSPRLQSDVQELKSIPSYQYIQNNMIIHIILLYSHFGIVDC